MGANRWMSLEGPVWETGRQTACCRRGEASVGESMLLSSLLKGQCGRNGALSISYKSEEGVLWVLLETAVWEAADGLCPSSGLANVKQAWKPTLSLTACGKCL